MLKRLEIARLVICETGVFKYVARRRKAQRSFLTSANIAIVRQKEKKNCAHHGKIGIIAKINTVVSLKSLIPSPVGVS